MIVKTLATTLRCSQDIYWRRIIAGAPETRPFLSTGAALHIVDHHLHVSGILGPRRADDDKSSRQHSADPADIYQHDWFCASQAVVCYPYDDLMQATLLARHGSFPQHEKEQDENAFRSHVWVTKVGNSSLQLGSMITCCPSSFRGPDLVLARVRRAFVRKVKAVVDDDNDSDALFREEERRILETYGAASDEITRLWNGDNDGSISSSDDDTPMPLFMPRLDNALPPYRKAEPLLTVKVGPQHTNFGQHADHACLASIAFQALEEGRRHPSVADEGKQSSSSIPLAVSYVAEAKVGDVLHCYMYGDRVYVEKQGSSSSSQPGILVLVAE
eukprot:scaffold7132_cov135-Amphora_coffeaeformis.AAC.2